MAVQIYERPSMSSLLGAAIGSGMSDLVDSYLQKKALKNLGFQGQEARSIAALNPQLQAQFIKSAMAERNKNNMIAMLLGGAGGQTGQTPQQPALPTGDLGVYSGVDQGNVVDNSGIRGAGQLSTGTIESIPEINDSNFLYKLGNPEMVNKALGAVSPAQQGITQEKRVESPVVKETSRTGFYEKDGDVYLTDSFKKSLLKKGKKPRIPGQLDLGRETAKGLATGLDLNTAVRFAGARGKQSQAERDRAINSFEKKWDKTEEKLDKANEQLGIIQDRISNYEIIEDLIDAPGGPLSMTGTSVGVLEKIKEHYGVEDFLSTQGTQQLRKALAREPLDMLKSLAKEGGATAARTKAVFDQIRQATGKMTNSRAGLLQIIKMNKMIANLNDKKIKLKNEIADLYREKGYLPPRNLDALAMKALEPEYKKLRNVGKETNASAKFDMLPESVKDKIISKGEGSEVDIKGIGRFKIRKIYPNNKFIDFEYVGRK